MKKYVPFISIFAIEFFFVVSGALNYVYSGKESSTAYTIYNILLFSFVNIYFVKDLVRTRLRLSYQDLLSLSLAVTIFVVFLIEFLMGKMNTAICERFQFFILWSFSSILMGIYLSKKERYKDIIYFFDSFLIISNIALVNAGISSILNKSIVSIGGANYQQAGYIFALTFGINLYLINFGNKYKRFKFANSKWYNNISRIFLLLQVFGVILTGARGAMVLVMVYSAYIFYRLFRLPSNLMKFIGLGVFMILTIKLNWRILSKNPIIAKSWNRIFAYISADGLNWAGTSGRDILYGNAIELIKQKPIIGYGFFGYWNELGFSPHNIILEVLLQGGLIYLVFFLFIMILFIKNIKRLSKYDIYFEAYSVVLVYPLVMLLFSGSYIYNSILWFVFSLSISVIHKNVNYID